MSAGIHVRIDPQRDGGTNAQLGRYQLQALQLFGGLDVEAVDADFQGTTHVVTGLADTGEDNLVGLPARSQDPLQLAPGDDVETGAQARQDIQYAQVGVGFYREADQVRHAGQGLGIGLVLGFDVRTGIDVGGRTETFGNGGQGYAFREQLSVAVVKSVHGLPLVGVVLVRLRLRLRLLFRGFAVIRQVQRAFLAAGGNEASNRDERSKGRDQALHGEILENA
ncbi:hypothetical protein PBOI14_74890 [Pseudomonas sp. Boi14]|nr:hypothetical protein PBOI14_74890 [Pseudomonas sp. Boi14]